MNKFPYIIGFSVIILVAVGAALLLLNQQNQTNQPSQQQEQELVTDNTQVNIDGGLREYLVFFTDSAKLTDAELLPPEMLTPAIRATGRQDVLTFVLEELINGPSAQESAAGLSGGLKSALQGDSNCDGRDFKVVSIVDGAAKIQFCKTLVGIGSFADGITLAAITKTALQFTTVDKVQILNKEGDCLFDESDLNLCLSRGYNLSL